MSGFLFLMVLTTSLIASLEAMSAFTAINGVVNGQHQIGLTTLVTSVNANLILKLGVFRATSEGLYFFTFSALSANNIGFRISLRKNGQPVVTGFADSQGFNTASLSCVVTMKRGDLMYPYLEEGALYESEKNDRSYTTFTGFQTMSFGGGGDIPNAQFFSGDDLDAPNAPQFHEANNTLEILPTPDPRDNIQKLVQQELQKEENKAKGV